MSQGLLYTGFGLDLGFKNHVVFFSKTSAIFDYSPTDSPMLWPTHFKILIFKNRFIIIPYY